jgi:plasmid stabilization system protein ParE
MIRASRRTVEDLADWICENYTHEERLELKRRLANSVRPSAINQPERPTA